ncbi:pyruvate dehydrogenase phosphatase regulatory subunit, mitochondrial-like isoform X2 [Halichondria panicea]
MNLEKETGLSTGCRATGNLNLARTKDKLTEFRRNVAVARSCGVIEAEIISPEQASELCPILKTDDLAGALYIPGDPSMGNPSDLIQSLAKGATMQGVRVVEGVGVERVEVESGRVRGVHTDQGYIECETFVNCAGQWARDLGALSDTPVNIPLHSTMHYYIITKPLEGVDFNMPTVRDKEGTMYIREWSGGLLVGCFETNGTPIFTEGIPKPFEFQLLPEDWEHIQPLMDQVLNRIPLMEKAEIRQQINGPESFTPDMHAIMGEAPEVDNYYVLAGLNSTGVASSGGYGHVLSQWIATGEPPMDLWEYDIARFSPFTSNKQYLKHRSKEVLGRHYAISYPGWELESGRGIKMNPMYSMQEGMGASWGCMDGWERANWYGKGKSADERVNNKTFGRPNWFDDVKEEHLACRNSVALFDMSTFAKFEIEGPDAESAMQQLCSNNVAVPPGTVVYTGLLNTQGGYQTDCTVSRLSADKYLLIAPSAQVTHVAKWVKKHLPSTVRLTDITAKYSVLALMGPKSREMLEQVTRVPLDNQHFPFSTVQTIDVGLVADVRALRMTFMGELGWELNIPTECSQSVLETLLSVGRDYSLKMGGAYAVDSLRIEKGYRHWSHEMDTETSPWEARLGFTVDLNKGDFIGRQALLEQRERGVRKSLVSFTVDIPADRDVLPWGSELIYRNGEYVGYATSASYGYSIGSPVVMGFVEAPKGVKKITTEYIKSGHYTVEIDGQRYPAKISLQPLYDPKSARVQM